MSLRAVWRALHNDTEARWRLFAVPLLAVLAWFLWFDTLEGALFLATIMAGMACGYVFAHGQRRFRHGLSSIGFWAFGAGSALFICGFAVAILTGEQTPGEAIGGVLVAASVLLMCFGVSLRGEARGL